MTKTTRPFWDLGFGICLVLGAWCLGFISRWVVASGSEGIAAADAPDPLAAADAGAVLVDGQDEVLAAAGVEAAHLRQARAEDELVEAHRHDQREAQKRVR